MKKIMMFFILIPLLFSSCTSMVLESVRDGSVSDLARAIEEGGNVNSMDVMGKTALMYAAESGDLDKVKLLVENGADIDYKNQNEYTALRYAVENNHIEVCRYLIENGADFDYKNEFGWTPLMTAAKYGHFEIFKMLLDYGADLEAKTYKREKTARDIALENEQWKIVKFIDKLYAEKQTDAK